LDQPKGALPSGGIAEAPLVPRGAKEDSGGGQIAPCARKVSRRAARTVEHRTPPKGIGIGGTVADAAIETLGLVEKGKGLLETPEHPKGVCPPASGVGPEIGIAPTPSPRRGEGVEVIGAFVVSGPAALAQATAEGRAAVVDRLPISAPMGLGEGLRKETHGGFQAPEKA
jgi:hypothetical protein